MTVSMCKYSFMIKGKKLIEIDGEKVDLSSSTIRNKLKRNEFNDDDLSKEILNYIKDNNLY